ncbi:calcium-binding protein [Roseibium sp.]|uniref:calcium-binding protein n=1 Tax=Roseibium sp. TaxID=1936156 RepID=UPI003A98060A
MANIQFSSLTTPFDISALGTVSFMFEVSKDSTTYVWRTPAGHTITATGLMSIAPMTGDINALLSQVSRLEINLDGDIFTEIDITFDTSVTLAPLLNGDQQFWETVLSGETTVESGFTDVITFAGDLPSLTAGESLAGGDDTFDFSDAVLGTVVSGDVMEAAGELTGGDDVITGSDADDILYGEYQSLASGGSVSGGDDTIDGGGGNDEIYGQTGDDTLIGGAGNDTIRGGRGHDTIDGGADNDFLFGDRGRDVFLVSTGNDTIDGGLGTDTIDFSPVLSGITGSAFVSLYDKTQPAGVFDKNITWGDPNGSSIVDFTDIEEFAFGDLDGVLTLEGFTGDETFIVRNSVNASVMAGMAGNDTFRGNSLLGDTVNYNLEELASGFLGIPGGNPRGALGAVVDLSTGTATDFFGDTDTLIDIETIIGTVNYYDGVRGDSGDNTIYNAEVVFAGGGDDTVTAISKAFGFTDPIYLPAELINFEGRGNTTPIFDGGAGTDTFIMYDDVISIDLTAENVILVQPGPSVFGTYLVPLLNFENVVGRGTITGNELDNELTGGATNDTISGMDGDDILIGGAGADTLDGGDGIDTVAFGDSYLAVTVNLLSGTGTGNDADGDTYIGIENIIGTNGDDFLIGDHQDNVIDGGNGGKDILDGGGNGAGGDTVSYASSAYGVTVSLAPHSVIVDTPVGVDWNDTISGFENIIGSERGDTLIGDSDANQLKGLGANDTLQGYDGNDTLVGGSGNDTLEGGSGEDLLVGGRDDDILEGGADADTFQFSDGHGNDTLLDFDVAEAAEFIDFSRVSTLNSFADVLASSVDTTDGVLITTGTESSVLLTGISQANLSDADFLFV